MRLKLRMPLAALLLTGCLGLAACGGEEKSSNSVQMKDLEVVDGTTSDAMTDLDGVQSEVPTPTVPGGSSGNAATSVPAGAAAANAAQSDTEVLSDQ